jgi:hypothetical protein
MRGVSVALPDAAKSKLQELSLTREAALDAARSAANRLNNSPRDTDKQILNRLTQERDRHNYRHAQLSQLLSRVNQWIMELRGGTLTLAPQINVELRSNETLNTAISNMRSEIAALHQQLAIVRRAPLPVSDQKQAALDYVARLARTARPNISVVKDTLRVTWHDDIIAGKDDALALLAWVAPDQVLATLERAIEQQPTPINSMPANERIARVSELEDQLQELEAREEALISRASNEGIEVLRRPDASPACVLGVVVTTAKAAVA